MEGWNHQTKVVYRINSQVFLLGFIFIPLLVFLVLVIFAEERAKEVKKKLEEDPINMDDEDDWDDEFDAWQNRNHLLYYMYNFWDWRLIWLHRYMKSK